MTLTCGTCAHRSLAPDIRVAAWVRANGLTRNKRRMLGIGTLNEMSICEKTGNKVVSPKSGACDAHEVTGPR